MTARRTAGRLAGTDGILFPPGYTLKYYQGSESGLTERAWRQVFALYD